MAIRRTRRPGAHLVTEAQRPRSADIAYRERRYLLMMGIRVLCFLVAVLVYVNGGGWLTAIPAIGAVAIPYFAVVFANGGREPTSTRGFRAYEPNLPERYRPPDEPGSGPDAAGSGSSGNGPAADG
ncbi:MAG TPA: DUF3099 domain-containing protein [Streptosporangiaceae bacterium]